MNKYLCVPGESKSLMSVGERGIEMFCEKCGAEIKENAKFCAACGAKVEKSDQNIDTGRKRQKQTRNSGNISAKKKRPVRRIVIAVGIIGLAMISALYFGLEEKKKREYGNFLSDGEKYMVELDYKNAEQAYLAAIEIDPKQEGPYLELADVYIVQGQYESAKNILTQGKKEISDESTQIDEKLDSIEYYVEYDWIVEPTIEADNIYYAYCMTIGVTNEAYQQWTNQYPIIEKDDKLGIIDMEGKMCTPLEFESVMEFYGGYKLVKADEVYDFDQYGNFTLSGGAGYDNYTYFYMDGELYGFNWYASEATSYIEEPDRAIPVQENTNNSDDVSALNGDWAVYYNGNLSTKFEYDYCGSESDGLLAVCKDGKWGYVNEEGETVIPLEYDPSWKENNDIVQEGGTHEFCYAASNGYIPLCKGDKWKLSDANGNVVIENGIFEQILPVYKNKCWVKKNGKWGVIQLKGDNIEDTDESLEESNEDQAWKQEYASILANWKTIENYYDTSYIADYFGSDYQFDEYFLYDINDDSVPELFLCSTAMGLTEVFTYSDGLVWCGEDLFAGINTATNELVVNGHWHGAGGSGIDEWSSYALKDQTLECTAYIDLLGDSYTIYRDGDYVSGTKEEYDAIYDQYFTNYTSYDSLEKYSLSDTSGLDAW